MNSVDKRIAYPASTHLTSRQDTFSTRQHTYSSRQHTPLSHQHTSKKVFKPGGARLSGVRDLFGTIWDLFGIYLLDLSSGYVDKT